jgi:type I restriction enzyme, S subunit
VNGWKTMPLGDVAESVDYGVTASATHQPIGPKFLRITDIQDGGVNWEEVPWCECDMRSASEGQLRAGDIVFARTGATTGKSFLISECPTDAVFASYLIRVRLSKVAEPRFVSHFFQTPDYWAQIAKSARGVAQPGVNATTLKALKIPLPPLPEQMRIAEILDKADALRAKRRTALAQLDILTPSIFFDMFGDPTTNAKGWPVVSIADICEVRGGKRLPKGEEYSSVPTPFRYIRVADLKSGRVDESALVYLKPEIQAEIGRYVVHTGDVIISIAGSIGVVAPVPESLDGVNLTENAAKLEPRSSGRYEAEYLARFLETGHAQAQIHSHVGQVTIGKLALFRIEKLKIPLPPVNLQREFARRAAQVRLQAAVQRSARSRFDELFASLQHRAFRGEL